MKKIKTEERTDIWEPHLSCKTLNCHDNTTISVLVCMASAPLWEYFLIDFNALEINGITLIVRCQSYQVSQNFVFLY